MTNLRVLLALFAILFIALPQSLYGQTSFTFTLSNSARTSAGVYTSDGTLVRTLWSGVPYNAGTHKQTWDGTDDNGMLTADGAYQIKVLSNNVKYEWEGVIGNTSASPTGASVFRHFWFMTNMVTVGNTAYYSTAYNESTPSQASFSLTDPQKRISIFENKGSQNTDFLATDDVNVYWGGIDSFANDTSFVFASKVADNSEVSFLQGKSLKMARGKTYKSAINIIDNADGHISGMAVQKYGNYLFVARKALNAIYVLNKTTGATVRRITNFTSPRSLSIDNGGNLWVVHGTNTVQKFAVNADGTLGIATVTLVGLVAPLAMGVSKDGTIVAVCDGGSSQQVKAFDNTTGKSIWTLGMAGGYAQDAIVSNNKFYFSEARGPLKTFIAFTNDGSFWVGDAGNYRAQHYSPNRTFLERIMYLPHVYSSRVDANNKTRVFADYLEFSVDYTKPLAPNNGSWTLLKNWGYNVPGTRDNHYSRLKCVTTLVNGRTYALQRMNSLGGKWELVELVENGVMRFTGITFPDAYTQLYADGSLRRIQRPSTDSPPSSQIWYKREITGFDNANNPQWTTEKDIASTPPATIHDPVFEGNSHKVSSGEVTSSKLVITFDGSLNGGYHLGAVKTGVNKWLWKAASSTHQNYKGDFPTDGTYDIGNGVKNAGTAVKVMDRNIIWGYHGEFWKNSQTNYYNHFYDNGLFIGQYGTGGPTNEQAPAGRAGNALSTDIVKIDNNTYYFYHCDEFTHSGVHRWKITGLNTIQEQTAQVVLSSGERGLRADYFSSPDLNSVNFITTTVERVVDKASQVNSIRWTGYVQAKYSQDYTFHIVGSNGLRLWIDNILVINQWANNTIQEYSSRKVALSADKKHIIKMEISKGSATLYWSSMSQAKEKISTTYLYPAKEIDRSKGVNLLEGLNFYSVLQNNLYGWNRNPVQEIYTDKYNNWWQVQTSLKSYNQLTGHSLNVGYKQKNPQTYTVTRDLGINNTNSWTLKGNVSYPGERPNTGTIGGQYLEILDETDKIIARFFTTMSFAGDRPYSIYGNTQVISTKAEAQMRPIITLYQPLEIKVSSTGVTFSYADFAPVTTSIFDKTASWQKPKRLRLYFWTSKGVNNNFGRIIDIKSMIFSTNTGNNSINNSVNPPPEAPTLSADDAANTLAVSHLLGDSEIVVSENNGIYTAYTGSIYVGNHSREQGYWKFKIKDATGSNESAIAYSPAFTTSASTKTLSSTINNGNDDVEESQHGGMYINSSDIELVNDGLSIDNQTIGLRFVNLAIPEEAIINNAYLQFTTDEAGSMTTSLTIKGENTDNSSPFTTEKYNVSSRNKTVASINWSPVAWTLIGAKGSAQRTPNLKAIIQQIVNRSGWSTGNALTLIMTGSGKRTVESFEGSATNAAMLVVEYSTNTTNARYTNFEEPQYSNRENIFSLNPNPFKDVLKASFTKDLEGKQASIKLINLQGKTLWSTSEIIQGSSIEIDAKQLRKGFYICIITIEGNHFSKKILKH